MRRVGWEILLVMRSSLCGVIDFSGCGLMRRFCRILFHFLDGAIFGVIVGCAAVIHVVWRFECVRPSVVASAAIRCSTSFIALCGSLVECSLISFLQRCYKIFLPICWRPAAIRINVVYWFGVASLIFIVARS
jgi:hypothetical protein